MCYTNQKFSDKILNRFIGCAFSSTLNFRKEKKEIFLTIEDVCTIISYCFYCRNLSFSCVMLKTGQTYFKNLAVWAPQDYKVCLVIFQYFPGKSEVVHKFSCFCELLKLTWDNESLRLTRVRCLSYPWYQSITEILMQTWMKNVCHWYKLLMEVYF